MNRYEATTGIFIDEHTTCHVGRISVSAKSIIEALAKVKRMHKNTKVMHEGKMCDREIVRIQRIS